MAVFKPFTAIRPKDNDTAQKVAALPYDVMNSEEAKQMAQGNPYSFLHIDKAEIDLPDGTDIYSEAVYKKASENLENLIKDACVKDETACFYIYEQTMNGNVQTGIVGCASIDDYINNVIKKHEFTRADKEQDRINHVDYCNANTGPIFLTYKANGAINETVGRVKKSAPVYDFVSEQGVKQTVWIIDNADDIKRINDCFAQTKSLYIADGHHRCASAVKVGIKRREENPQYNGNEEFNFFLAVAFPENELKIMDYNRVVKDLNGHSKDEYLSLVSEKFDVEEIGTKQYKPTEKHTFGMYLDGKWYKLSAKSGTFDGNDPVARLDVAILQNNLLTPVLNIGDPRTDKRIDFIGGIRGLGELEKEVNSSKAVAFAMFPTTTQDLMDIADAGKIMPPKSTWFEPKLLSGLFIHKLG